MMLYMVLHSVGKTGRSIGLRFVYLFVWRLDPSCEDDRSVNTETRCLNAHSDVTVGLCGIKSRRISYIRYRGLSRFNIDAVIELAPTLTPFVLDGSYIVARIDPLGDI